MRVPILFLLVALATLAWADEFLAVVGCDSSRARAVWVSQILQAETGVKITGRTVVATHGPFPVLMMTGHQSRNDFSISTAGILKPDGQMNWLWSPDQEAKLRAAQEQADLDDDKKGLVAKIFSGFGLTTASDPSDQIRGEKFGALLNLDLNYQSIIRDFDGSHACSEVSITVQATENVELNCNDFEFSSLKMKDVVDANVLVSASILHGKGMLSSLAQEKYSEVRLGVYDACDGFTRVR